MTTVSLVLYLFYFVDEIDERKLTVVVDNEESTMEFIDFLSTDVSILLNFCFHFICYFFLLADLLEISYDV